MSATHVRRTTAITLVSIGIVLLVGGGAVAVWAWLHRAADDWYAYAPLSHYRFTPAVSPWRVTGLVAAAVGLVVGVLGAALLIHDRRRAR